MSKEIMIQYWLKKAHEDIWLFENRQKADYRPLVEFDPEQVEEILVQSQGFVKEMERLSKLRESEVRSDKSKGRGAPPK